MKKIDFGKINWKKVATIGGCIVTGMMAFWEAIEEHKQSERVDDMEKRLSELEKEHEEV